MSDTTEPYFIEIETVGCTCGHGKMWTVVGPDGLGSSTSYGDEEEAQYIADILNEAFAHGLAAGKTNLELEILRKGITK